MKVSLKCHCGALRGVANDISASSGNRIVCMCADCQAFAHFLGRADTVLDKNGGTDIFQLAPCSLKITQGIEQLKCIRLTSKGLCRWYAACCNTPIANTLHSHKGPFAGTIHSMMDHANDGQSRDQALGPVLARIHGKSGIAPLPSDAHQTVPFGIVLRMVGFLFSGWIKGHHAPSPFFDANTGKPIVAPGVLSTAERERIRKLCGPKA